MTGPAMPVHAGQQPACGIKAVQHVSAHMKVQYTNRVPGQVKKLWPGKWSQKNSSGLSQKMMPPQLENKAAVNQTMKVVVIGMYLPAQPSRIGTTTYGPLDFRASEGTVVRWSLRLMLCKGSGHVSMIHI